MKAFQHSGSGACGRWTMTPGTVSVFGGILLWALMILIQARADAASYPLVGGSLTRGGSTDFTVSVPEGAFVDTLEFRLAAEVGSEGFVDYLDVRLISPSGTSVRLLASSQVDDETGFLDGLRLEDTVFSEASATAIEDGVAPYGGRYKVDGWTSSTGLGQFRGQRAGGIWTLRVVDAGAAGGKVFGTGNASSAAWATLGSALLITPLPSDQQPPKMLAASDTGVSDTDAITRNTTPIFTGTAASGAQVALMKGATSLGTTTAAADGSWSITSTSLTEGTHLIRAVATRGGSVVETLSQTVVIDLTAPELTQPADAETDEDTPSLPVKFVVSDTLSPVAALLVSGSGDPASLVESVTPGGSGAARNVVVQPAAGRSGTAVIRVVVTDQAGNTAQKTFNLTVVDVNKAPVLGADTLTRVTGDRVVKVKASVLLANDTDSDGDALTIDSVSTALPDGATVGISGAFIVYSVPSGTTGGGSFSYTISDGLGGHRVTGTVTVVEAVSSATSDSAVPQSVAADGRDTVLKWLGVPRRLYRVQYTTSTGAPFSWRDFAPPVELAAARSNVVGLFTHRDVNPPEASRFYRAVPVGWDNLAPILVDDTVGRPGNRREFSVSIASVLSNDSDPDLDSLTVVSVGSAQPVGSTVVIDGDSILYTAPPSNEGPGSFEYEVSDGVGGHRVKAKVIVEKVD